MGRWLLRRGGQGGNVLCRGDCPHRDRKGDNEVEGETGGIDVEVELVLDAYDVARSSEVCWWQ